MHVTAHRSRCVYVGNEAELSASARVGEVFAVGREGVRVVRADGPESALAPAPKGARGVVRVDPRGAVWNEGSALKWRDRDADAPREFESAHEGGARAVAFSPDGAQLATVGDDRRVRLWRTEDSAPLWTFEGHREPIGAVGFAPDGRTLYSAGVSGELKAWDLSSGHERDTLAVRELSGVVPFEAMRLSPDGTRLALRAGTPRQVREVDLLRWAERAHPSLDLACWELAYDPEGALVMIARPSWQSEVLRVAPSGEVLSSVVLGLPVENGWTAPKLTYRALALLGPEARTMALSRDARTGHFVVGRVDRASKLLSVRFDGAVCVERAALGRRRVAAGTRGRLWCWELRETFCGWSPAQREAAWSAELPQRDAVTALALSPDERTLVATTDRGAVLAWRIETR